MRTTSTVKVSIAIGLMVGVTAVTPQLRSELTAQNVPPPAGRMGPGGGRGFGGVQPDQPLVAQFDKDGDKRLNADERRAARAFVESQGGGRAGRGRGGPGAGATTAQPGPSMSKSAVKPVPASVPFYDLNTVRTLFLDFENADWEKELIAFKDTDVEVPATLTIDGKAYPNVGVSFRGASSFMMIPEGQKHSINLTIDFVDSRQSVQGFRTLNLLNAHEDPSLLRTVLYLQAAREYVPAPRANFARVVLNGESWGVYTNAEQFNKDFVNAWFKTEKGARWKVPGSPGGRAGLEYFGENVEDYKRVFEIKTKDDPKDWAALVKLTRVLAQTPADQLEAALAPILDVDATLKFLALETVLVNNDGYWVRASDYSLYLDTSGKFHVIPHDANETFATGAGRGGRRGAFGPPPGPGGPPADVFVTRGGPPEGFPPGGPGGRRGGGMMGGGPDLDILVGLDDATKPLRSKLLAVPALRARYIAHARAIASKWLDWNTLGPLVTRYQALIAADVKSDTRKLNSTEEFDASAQALKQFAETRRARVLAVQ